MTDDGDDDRRFKVEPDSTLYMCGHGGWNVCRVGSQRTLAHITAGPIEALRLEALLNGVAPITQYYTALTREERDRVERIKRSREAPAYASEDADLDYLLDLVEVLSSGRRHQTGDDVR